ncbi:MAG: hypothetical protein OFPII_37430 [Osedax symbiont Rs1]|nr:MAG: hypothetical protein OFPII_37430 [Osedax symbiont Rs1]
MRARIDRAKCNAMDFRSVFETGIGDNIFFKTRQKYTDGLEA